MREETPQAEQLNFFVTYFDSDTKTEYMVATPDIAWVMIVFRLGLIGTVAFILFFSKFSSFFLTKRKIVSFSLGTHLFWLFLLFVSFTGSDLAYIWPFLMPFLDSHIIKKIEKSKPINKEEVMVLQQ